MKSLIERITGWEGEPSISTCNAWQKFKSISIIWLLTVTVCISLPTLTLASDAKSDKNQFITAWASAMYLPGTDPTSLFVYSIICNTESSFFVFNPPKSAQEAKDICFSLVGYGFTGLNDQTVRSIIRPAISGDNILRIKLSNVYGSLPLVIGAASIGLQDHDAKLLNKSVVKLSFQGATGVTIQPGTLVYSDPVKLKFSKDQNLAVSLYFQGPTGNTSVGGNLQVGSVLNWYTYISNVQGNQTLENDLGISTTTIVPWYFNLSGIEVKKDETKVVAIAFGDSILNGEFGTVNKPNHWHEILSKKLGNRGGILNLGIGGSSLTVGSPVFNPFGPSGQNRFDLDVLGQRGATAMIMLYGTNDMNILNLPAVFIEAGLTDVITQAKNADLIVVCGTIPPGNMSTANEVSRLAINEFIRTNSQCDSIADFDLTLRNPNNPSVLNPLYDSGDHLHPNDLGEAVMANTVDIEALLKKDKK